MDYLRNTNFCFPIYGHPQLLLDNCILCCPHCVTLYLYIYLPISSKLFSDCAYLIITTYSITKYGRRNHSRNNIHWCRWGSSLLCCTFVHLVPPPQQNKWKSFVAHLWSLQWDCKINHHYSTCKECFLVPYLRNTINGFKCLRWLLRVTTNHSS